MTNQTSSASFSTPEAFICLRCGNCCHGEGGIVLNDSDVHRLCNHLDLDLASFAAVYMESVNGKNRLRTNEQGWCIFFEQGCAVHPAKPAVCQAWPFFRGNMVDANSWLMAQDACPGINNETGHQEFVAQGNSYLQDLDLEPSTATSPNALNRST
ncbi:hypothetical protein SAMN05660653_01475 [Desulfonatronum thiosulfatophilum]|uniref:Zinc-or iron-chelating domain-containing protein n=1 Tax=Desulfonatronum thiosulfatophilum TaxID=617002 RepID=A0A1G6CC40_9BACT|nr:YkgJ family cysteine cluster protein [Desulfonatronum thiosulfatophilum]SDB30423.1 hypothetical protein SAMN05660653_01475 [Desulfonatronum thiosulfatophilum]